VVESTESFGEGDIEGGLELEETGSVSKSEIKDRQRRTKTGAMMMKKYCTINSTVTKGLKWDRKRQE
jgi:hypothetical protein